MAADGEKLQGEVQDQPKILTQTELDKILTQFMRELVKESIKEIGHDASHQTSIPSSPLLGGQQ